MEEKFNIHTRYDCAKGILTFKTQFHSQGVQSMWDLWWTKWHYNIFLSKYIIFAMSL